MSVFESVSGFDPIVGLYVLLVASVMFAFALGVIAMGALLVSVKLMGRIAKVVEWVLRLDRIGLLQGADGGDGEVFGSRREYLKQMEEEYGDWEAGVVTQADRARRAREMDDLDD